MILEILEVEDWGFFGLLVDGEMGEVFAGWVLSWARYDQDVLRSKGWGVYLKPVVNFEGSQMAFEVLQMRIDSWSSCRRVPLSSPQRQTASVEQDFGGQDPRYFISCSASSS